MNQTERHFHMLPDSVLCYNNSILPFLQDVSVYHNEMW